MGSVLGGVGEARPHPNLAPGRPRIARKTDAGRVRVVFNPRIARVLEILLGSVDVEILDRDVIARRPSLQHVGVRVEVVGDCAVPGVVRPGLTGKVEPPNFCPLEHVVDRVGAQVERHALAGLVLEHLDPPFLVVVGLDAEHLVRALQHVLQHLVVAFLLQKLPAKRHHLAQIVTHHDLVDDAKLLEVFPKPILGDVFGEVLEHDAVVVHGDGV